MKINNLLGSAILVAVVCYGTFHMIRVQSWPETQGVISGVTIGKRTDHEDNRLVSYYYPSFTYTYEVDGKHYQEKGRTQEESTFYSGAQRKIADFPDGTPVRVKYNPDAPENSELATARLTRQKQRLFGLL
ncbi:DUF3592 domain-containing protein [Pseudomonas solani]|uniref:DUF3592 domain-containing protein n=1 Tax=Pseudomonas solani TaxID=2731552 RepID=UPI003C2EFC2D